MFYFLWDLILNFDNVEGGGEICGTNYYIGLQDKRLSTMISDLCINNVKLAIVKNVQWKKISYTNFILEIKTSFLVLWL